LDGGFARRPKKTDGASDNMPSPSNQAGSDQAWPDRSPLPGRQKPLAAEVFEPRPGLPDPINRWQEIVFAEMKNEVYKTLPPPLARARIHAFAHLPIYYRRHCPERSRRERRAMSDEALVIGEFFDRACPG
jgi:hypothetical protein